MQKNNYFRNVNPKKNLDDKDLYPKKKKPKVKENIKRNYYLLLFFLILGSIPKNGYSKIDQINMNIECFFDRENADQILRNAILKDIQDYVSYFNSEYQMAMNYLLDHYAHRLKVSDLPDIHQLMSKDIYDYQKENSLIFDCIQTIVLGNKEKNVGNLRLSIMCDIIGEENVVYYLLTNKEELLYKSLRARLSLTEQEMNSFLNDLDQLNKLSNNESIKSTYQFSKKTNLIINQYSTIPVERHLLNQILTYQDTEPTFIPSGSFLSRKSDTYPVRIHNNYFSTTIIQSTKNNKTCSLSDDLNLINRESLQEEISKEESYSLWLLSFLVTDKMPLNYLNLDQESKQQFLEKMDNNLKQKNLDLASFTHGFNQKDPQTLQIYLDYYLYFLLNSEINLEKICEINELQKYLSQKEFQIGENASLYQNMLEYFLANIKEILRIQGKEIMWRFLTDYKIYYYYDNESKKYKTPENYYYDLYEIKYDLDSENTFWNFKVPVNQTIIPNVLLEYQNGTYQMIDFQEFCSDAQIIRDENKDYYEILKKKKEKQICIFFRIDEHLKNQKSMSRKKIQK